MGLLVRSMASSSGKYGDKNDVTVACGQGCHGDGGVLVVTIDAISDGRGTSGCLWENNNTVAPQTTSMA